MVQINQILLLFQHKEMMVDPDILMGPLMVSVVAVVVPVVLEQLQEVLVNVDLVEPVFNYQQHSVILLLLG